MANVLTGGIKQFDAAGAITGIRRVRLIQWVCDAGDIAKNSDLVFVLGGVTFTVKAKMGAADDIGDIGQQSIVPLEIGPFDPGIHIDGYSVTTIDHGVLYIWED